MLRTLAILTLFATTLAAKAEMPMETYGLDRAIKAALNNSAPIQSSAEGIKIAEERVLEARLRFLPDVGLQATATRFKARRPFAHGVGRRSTLLFPSDKKNLYSGQGYILLSLYEGRRNINTLRLAKTSLKQARSRFDTVKMDVLYKTKDAFYRLLLAQTNLRNVDKILSVVEKTRSSHANAWQKVESRALFSELRAVQAESRHNMELARIDFLKALNLELDREIRIEGTLKTEPLQIELSKALVWATELRPELHAQTLKAEMDAISVNLALSRRNPTVFLGFDYELTSEEFPLNQNNWDATVGIRLPFAFDFWTQHNQKVAVQRQAEIGRSEMRDLVHVEVRKAHSDLSYWEKEWRRREKEAVDLTQLLASARGQEGRTSDILRAAAGVLGAGQRHLEAVTAHLIARARLERAVGRSLSQSQ